MKNSVKDSNTITERMETDNDETIFYWSPHKFIIFNRNNFIREDFNKNKVFLSNFYTTTTITTRQSVA
jgi:hypothetical protein